MPIKECCACGGPVELPDAHDACVFCLGRAHAEAALDGPDCPFCEEMTVKTLRARVSVILNCALANPLPPPPVAVEPREGRQPRAEGPSDEWMSTQFLHAHHSKEPPVSFTKTSLRPSDDARDLVWFGAAEDDLDDDDDAMSTAASGSGDWSACLESEASHSEVREPPAPIDEELVKILSEAVQDLGLDWSPPEQPTKNRLDMRYLQSGRQVAAPQRPAPFFPEVHEEISRSWRSPYSAQAQAAGLRMLSSVDGADRWGYTKPPPVEEVVAAHLCPSARGWKSAPSLPSKPCRTTSHIADKAYMAAGQAASAIHTMAVLQAFQAKMLHTLDEEGPDSAAFKKLRSATDLALRATKKMAQGIGRCKGSLVTLQRHLWLTLTDMRESEKAQLLDAPISPLGLFGDAVGSFSEKFLEAQKQSKAMSHFLPKRDRSAAPPPRSRSSSSQRSVRMTVWIRSQRRTHYAQSVPCGFIWRGLVTSDRRNSCLYVSVAVPMGCQCLNNGCLIGLWKRSRWRMLLEMRPVRGECTPTQREKWLRRGPGQK
ncbi:hypothetical protein M9458_006331, partial [Cirrhinus mrigala]